MYKKVEQLETQSENFELLFGGKLLGAFPWSEVEEEYAKKFTLYIRSTSKVEPNVIGSINNQRKTRDKRQRDGRTS